MCLARANEATTVQNSFLASCTLSTDRSIVRFYRFCYSLLTGHTVHACSRLCENLRATFDRPHVRDCCTQLCSMNQRFLCCAILAASLRVVALAAIQYAAALYASVLQLEKGSIRGAKRLRISTVFSFVGHFGAFRRPVSRAPRAGLSLLCSGSGVRDSTTMWQPHPKLYSTSFAS